MRIRIIFSAVCLLLSGCMLKPPVQPVVPPPLTFGLNLSPASFGQTISVQQHLTLERAGSSQELDAALEIDPRQLHLVGLVMDQRVLTLTYDGKTLQVWRHVRLPKEVSGEKVLEDLELTLWPIGPLRQALPAGFRIEQQTRSRTLLFDGQVVEVIDYSNKEHWTGRVTITNLRYHYRLIIQSVPNELP